MKQDSVMPVKQRDIILDSIADGVFTVDHHWRITSFNRAAEKITGVSRTEALGQRCRREAAAGCHGDEGLELLEAIHRPKITVIEVKAECVPAFFLAETGCNTMTGPDSLRYPRPRGHR